MDDIYSKSYPIIWNYDLQDVRIAMIILEKIPAGLSNIAPDISGFGDCRGFGF